MKDNEAGAMFMGFLIGIMIVLVIIAVSLPNKEKTNTQSDISKVECAK